MGNTTLLIGTEDERADEAVEILKKHCTTRKHINAHTSSFGASMKSNSLPEAVTVGGATVFVMDVGRMEKF